MLSPRRIPLASTTPLIISYSPPGNQSCQGRNTSAIRIAATSTIARTTQLITVP